MAETHPAPASQVTRLRGEATLPGGKKIAMRELTGTDELNATAEAGDVDSAEGRIRQNWCLIRRSAVSVDGVPVDQTTQPEVFRNSFSRKEWTAVQELFDKLHTPEEKELGSFRSSIRLSA
jgi:hypothetical protein